ncbi:unnamed protein product [Arctia plantaginis]|uniref:Uncharacterized protein n=1 Tax=Arctia plantaginis TaxID=874455 RepID=A0A8S0ZQ75_ARCPL|nr:unnamed protein product [Arctia plantaginis]CAB3250480.1 unnamed protein product [Arctia plantaginis]
MRAYALFIYSILNFNKSRINRHMIPKELNNAKNKGQKVKLKKKSVMHALTAQAQQGNERRQVPHDQSQYRISVNVTGFKSPNYV